ncbi:hypothetical protein [Coleofasciculus sp.]
MGLRNAPRVCDRLTLLSPSGDVIALPYQPQALLDKENFSD